jgi:hypothetical protein
MRAWQFQVEQDGKVFPGQFLKDPFQGFSLRERRKPIAFFPFKQGPVHEPSDIFPFNPAYHCGKFPERAGRQVQFTGPGNELELLQILSARKFLKKADFHPLPPPTREFSEEKFSKK